MIEHTIPLSAKLKATIKGELGAFHYSFLTTRNPDHFGYVSMECYGSSKKREPKLTDSPLPNYDEYMILTIYRAHNDIDTTENGHNVSHFYPLE